MQKEIKLKMINLKLNQGTGTQQSNVFTSVLVPSITSFMLMAFLPLSLFFFLFFFLNIHFLQTQKQQANTRMMATNAMETMAQDGTGDRRKEIWNENLGSSEMHHEKTLSVHWG